MKTYDPNENHVIDDDFEAAVLIAALGNNILDRLTPEPGCNQAHHMYSTEHHWCMASFHCGHERDQDNGYVVVMFSKTMFAREEAMLTFALCIEENTEEGGSYSWRCFKISHSTHIPAGVGATSRD